MSGSVGFKSFKYKDDEPGRTFAISRAEGGTYTATKPANRTIRPTGWQDVPKVWYRVYDGPNLLATESYESTPAGTMLTDCVTGPGA